MSRKQDLRPRFLYTKEAARFACLSLRTMEKHRSYGTGPLYRKLGGRVVYSIDDLVEWADKGQRRSVSGPGIGIIDPAKRANKGKATL